jgi:hypothetical protein
MCNVFCHAFLYLMNQTQFPPVVTVFKGTGLKFKNRCRCLGSATWCSVYTRFFSLQDSTHSTLVLDPYCCDKEVRECRNQCCQITVDTSILLKSSGK